MNVGDVILIVGGGVSASVWWVGSADESVKALEAASDAWITVRTLFGGWIRESRANVE